PTSSKFPLWRAHSSLCAPIESALPIRTSTCKWSRSDEERADRFVEHLQNVFQPNTASNGISLPLTSNTSTTNQSIVFTPHEILKIINEQLNPKKSPGCDQISAKMIVELPSCAVRVIFQLFNAITRHGHFPERWKKCNTAMSDEYIIRARVPQGSVLGPTLYLIYTADIPISRQLTTSTFADDTAFLSRSRCAKQATAQLASHLVAVHKWLSDWRIKVNEQKYKHVTFT
ncbi:hypothetical protein KR093_004436, partial [Drosophila rubida]